MILRSLLAALLFVSGTSFSQSQDVSPYSPRQAVSAFMEYSNTSSHILLGASQNRRFAAFGLGYSLRLFHTRHVDWYYAPEVLPVIFLEDPVATDAIDLTGIGSFRQSGPTVSPCRAENFTVPTEPTNGPAEVIFNRTCSSRWTYAGGLSPLGQRFNFRPRSRLQPFVIGNAGFLVATRDVPVNDSSRFNFTFEFGAGVEFFRDHHRSWSIDYRLHHLSNDYTGTYNPGVDNQIFRLTYKLGR